MKRVKEIIHTAQNRSTHEGGESRISKGQNRNGKKVISTRKTFITVSVRTSHSH